MSGPRAPPPAHGLPPTAAPSAAAGPSTAPAPGAAPGPSSQNPPLSTGAGGSTTQAVPVRPNVYVPPPKLPPRKPRARMPYVPLPPRLTVSDRLHRGVLWGLMGLTLGATYMLGKGVATKVLRRYGIELNPDNPDILRSKAQQQAHEEQMAARAAGIPFNPLGSLPVEVGTPAVPMPQVEEEPVREV